MKTRSWRRGWLRPTAALTRHLFVAGLSLVLIVLGFVATFLVQIRTVAYGVIFTWTDWMKAFFPRIDYDWTIHGFGFLLLVLGVWAFVQSVRGFFRQLTGGDGASTVLNDFLRKQQLANGPRVVAIGGGTGLSTLLRGLKQYTSNITAIVTVTDDGGSSGRLVTDLGIMPPGDIRQCLVALADAEKRMTDVFQHRFTKGAGALAGHNIGNLLIAGFIERAGGDMDRALELASGVLNIRGRVVPSTKDPVRLRARLVDDTEIDGETAIVESGRRIKQLYLSNETARAHPDAIAAIAEADLICIGPGSVYTSVIPNLLVKGIAEAITTSAAKKVYICNVMTQRGESESFTAAEHVVAINSNVPLRVFDYVLVNTAVPTQQTLDKYREYEQDLVTADIDRIKHMGLRPVAGNFMSETDMVRHDPFKVAARLFHLLD